MLRIIASWWVCFAFVATSAAQTPTVTPTPPAESEVVSKLRSRVERLERERLGLETMLRFALPRIPKEELAKANPVLRRRIQMHANRYRRVHEQRAGEPADLGSVFAEAEAALAEAKATNKRLRERLDAMMNSDAPITPQVAREILLKRFEQAKKAGPEAHPKPTTQHSLDQANRSVDVWLAANTRRLHAELAADEVNRARVDRTLSILEQLVKGRAQLQDLKDPQAIDRELHRLRMVHVGVRRKQ